MKNPIIHIALLLLVFLALEANIGLAVEPNDVVATLRIVMEQAQRDESPDAISSEKLKSADPNRILVLLAPYEKSQSPRARHLAIRFVAKLARLHHKPEIRQEVARRLVKHLVGQDHHTFGHSYVSLLSFTERDFTANSKAVIRQSLATPGPRDRYIIMICGVANIKEELPRLKELLIDELAYKVEVERAGKGTPYGLWYNRTGWWARLARARMGVKEEITRCIEVVEEEQDLDTRVLELLPQIGYIRQPQATEYLGPYLHSTERLRPTNPGSQGVPVPQYVMDILAESFSNFPVKKRVAHGYKQEEIELCRKWMADPNGWEIRR